jgi:ATP-dependent RNA helicase TDRD9
LIFLPGLAEIFYFLEQLQGALKAIKYPTDQFDIITLHSDLTKDFDLRKLDHRKRYFILATNIAESSITIPDIAFVIDFCLTKELFVHKDQISCLELVWSSRASCLQRKGRTGRMNHGYCFYMLPKTFFFKNLHEHATPEMLRIPLDKIILKCNLIKSLLKGFRMSLNEEPSYLRGQDDSESQSNQRKQKIERLLRIFSNPHFVLRLALDVPEESKIENSLKFLKTISAIKFNSCSKEFENSFLGKLYCHLPLPISSIKLIIFGKIFNCLEDAINIASLINHSKGILKLSKHMKQDQLIRLFNLYQRMDEHQYSDIIILNNLYKGSP